MKFLADENVKLALVAGLSELGHDVAKVKAERKGAIDSEVLARAAVDGRDASS